MDTLISTILAGLAVPLTGMLCAACYMAISWMKSRTRALDIANLNNEAVAAIGAGVDAVSKREPRLVIDGIRTYFRQRFPDRTAQIVKLTGAAGPFSEHEAVVATIASRLTNINPATTLLPGPGGVASGLTGLAAPTLPAPLPDAAVPLSG